MLVQIPRELTLLPRDALLQAFAALERADVAFYDARTQMVWVTEMAALRVNPHGPGQTLAQ